MMDPWLKEISSLEAGETEKYKIRRGEEYNGVRVDAVGQRISDVIDSVVSSYNSTVAEEDTVDCVFEEIDNEVVIPERIYAEMPSVSSDLWMKAGEKNDIEQYRIVVPSSENRPSYVSHGDTIVERYLANDELPERLADDLCAAVDGCLLQGSMLYMTQEEYHLPQNTVRRQTGEEERLSLMYRSVG